MTERNDTFRFKQYEVNTLFEYLKKLMKDKDKVVNQESRKRIGFGKKK